MRRTNEETKASKKEHKLEMKLRRQRQLERRPDEDARVVYFSKNSLREYRKDYVRKFG